METVTATEGEIGEAFTDCKPIDADDVPVLKFIKIEQYTTFRAEYAIDGDDLVFHFFLPPEMNDRMNSLPVRKYWLEEFPKVFEPVVFETFKAAPPRVQAKYISDMGLNSWWFRAFGFSKGLEPERLCGVFCESLDKGLDQLLSTTKNT